MVLKWRLIVKMKARQWAPVAPLGRIHGICWGLREGSFPWLDMDHIWLLGVHGAHLIEHAPEGPFCLFLLLGDLGLGLQSVGGKGNRSKTTGTGLQSGFSSASAVRISLFFGSALAAVRRVA